MLAMATAKMEGRIEELEDKLNDVRDQMSQLKVELYARFGKSINLEA
jgi:prefoldin subunit 4